MEFFDNLTSAIEGHYYKFVEEHSDPKFDEILNLAMEYRAGNEHAGEQFEKRLTTRSPKYLDKLIVHARDSRPETLDALANGVSLLHDEPLTKNDLLELINDLK